MADSTLALKKASSQLYFSDLEIAAQDLRLMADRIDNGEDLEDAYLATFREHNLAVAGAVDHRIATLKLLEDGITHLKQLEKEQNTVRKRMELMLSKIKERTTATIGLDENLPYRGRTEHFKIQNNAEALATDFRLDSRSFTNIITIDKIEAYGLHEYIEKVELFTLNKTKLKADVKAGKEVNGCRLTQTKSLRIKPNI